MRLGNSKRHTQHDIIINIAQWAPFPLIMLHSQKGNFSYALHKPSRTRRTLKNHSPLYLYSNYLFIYIFNRKLWTLQSQTMTHSHKQELVFLCTETYRTPSHKYIKMTVTKPNATNSLMQPNDVSLGCKVFKVPFLMAYQFDGSQASPNDLGSL